MNEFYHKILSLLEGKEIIEFSIFYDKALADGDTVARLEEEIGRLKLDLLNLPIGSVTPDTYRTELTHNITSMLVILHGDKPDDNPNENQLC